MLPNFENFVVEEEEGSGIKVMVYITFSTKFQPTTLSLLIYLLLLLNKYMQEVTVLFTGRGEKLMELKLPLSVSEVIF